MTTRAGSVTAPTSVVVRRWAGRALLALLVLAALVGLAALVVAWQQQSAARGLFGDLDRWERDYPIREPNATALQVEELAARLGAELAPIRAEGRASADPDVAKEFVLAGGSAARYLQGQLGREDAAVDRPDPAVLSFLEDHAGDLDALASALVDGPVPLWERRIVGINATIAPRLITLMKLETLFGARALEAVRRGDEQAARRDLRAIDRLIAGIEREPLLIDQLMVLALERRRLAIARRLPSLPRALIERRDPAALRKILDEALRYEPASKAMLARDLTQVSQTGFEVFLVDPVRFPPTRWYARLCLLDGALAMERRRRRAEPGATACLAVREDSEVSAPLAFSAWNLFDEGAEGWPRLIDASLQRFSRLVLEREMTVLWAGLLEEGDGGGPYVRRVASATCPGDGAFVVERTADGVRRVAWDGPLRPERPRGRIPLAQRLGRHLE